MKQNIPVRRWITSGLIATAIVVAGCGQGSQNVETRPASDAPTAAATSPYADLSADAASHWSESSVAPNYYPHGYDYGADDVVAEEPTRPADGPLPH